MEFGWVKEWGKPESSKVTLCKAQVVLGIHGVPLLPAQLPGYNTGQLMYTVPGSNKEPQKSLNNKKKHGIDFAEAQVLWDDPEKYCVMNYRMAS